MALVPDTLARNAAGAWGDRGRRWVSELPRIIDELLCRWSLRFEEPLTMTFHWVAAVSRDDGTPAVLKLGVPGSDHQPVEAATLTAWAGRGAMALLEHDPDRGALLLRRARPGRMLRELVPARDEDATDIAAGVMRLLHAAPVPHSGVPALTDARSSFVRYLLAHPTESALPRRLVEHALGRFDDLVISGPASVVLHGDLHHDNVLSDDTSPTGWVAIDPHGWVGDPAFEIGPFLYNPDPAARSEELLRLVPGRIECLAHALGVLLDRALAWGFVTAVLSEVWSTEDSTHYAPGRALDVALLLERQLD
jgi:streptomycin 6-kinase